MNVHPMDEHGLISGSNRNVEFQAVLNVPSLDLTPITYPEDGDNQDHDFRGAPYSYKYEDDKGNFISAMGWDMDEVVLISNFFLKYLDKSIDYKDVILDEKIRRWYE
jgi:hypothetical protein